MDGAAALILRDTILDKLAIALFIIPYYIVVAIADLTIQVFGCVNGQSFYLFVALFSVGYCVVEKEWESLALMMLISFTEALSVALICFPDESAGEVGAILAEDWALMDLAKAVVNKIKPRV